MALQYPNFYGDLSAFVSPLHINPLQEILDSSTLRCKIVFGSDFPVYLMPIWFVSKLGIKRVNELGKLENPFERSYSTMKALGVPDEVFARAENLLRLPRVAASPVVKRAEERAT
ncbi:MAG: hypothetical protein A2X46_06510 [Lentisphaerae bacterium GWF2_57_35]|nr:MAG: hypothetical protein A2X46_06510 [Lentisphaerae bacterium GWF2_57_35]